MKSKLIGSERIDFCGKSMSKCYEKTIMTLIKIAGLRKVNAYYKVIIRIFWACWQIIKLKLVCKIFDKLLQLVEKCGNANVL
jgi:hypothetical protein